MPVKRANAVLLALGVSFGILPYVNAEVLPTPKPSEQYLILEKFQNEANSKPGPRHVPEKLIPVPKTASARVQELTSSPYQLPKWTANHPVTPDDWKRVVEPAAQATIQKLPELHKKLGVVVNKIKVGGVPAYEIVPKNLPPENATRILLHIHGGGFTYNPGEAGTLEAILMAAYGRYKVISVDYRLAPDHPYPAALDDVTNAYKYIISKYSK